MKNVLFLFNWGHAHVQMIILQRKIGRLFNLSLPAHMQTHTVHFGKNCG